MFADRNRTKVRRLLADFIPVAGAPSAVGFQIIAKQAGKLLILGPVNFGTQDYALINRVCGNERAMKAPNKRENPAVGLLAGVLILVVVGVGVVSGYLPLRGASSEGVELADWPVLFWLYAAILTTLAVTLIGWSFWTLLKGSGRP